MEKQSLAKEVLGVSRLDEDDALRRAYTTLTGLDVELFDAECARIDDYDLSDWANISPHDQECITTLLILRQIFEAGQIKYSNVLQHWPTYEASYRQLEGTDSQDRDSRQALQIGCLTALSSVAFAAIARDVYNARPTTIDLTASGMRARGGGYVVTDALQLGIASDSMHVVQTNCLLHMLETPQKTDFFSQASQLFHEMYRVAEPGGHVLLREIASGLDAKNEHPHYSSDKSKARFEWFKEEVFTGLAQAGFRSILMTPASEIKGVDYLFDPERNFTRYETYERAATIVVSASKHS